VRIAPYVQLDRAPSVWIDDERAAYEMTKLLLGLGHTRIGFIKGHPQHGSTHLRYEGYCRALAEHGIEIDPPMVQQGYFSFDSGLAGGEALLAHWIRPSAVFASNDDMALGVVSVATRLGMRLPQDLSVVGFDDAYSARMVWPPLTTVRQPIAEMAATAAEMLIWRRRREEDGAPAKQVFDVTITQRASSARFGQSAAGS
jgi:LacI family transcriptional regulator